MSHERYAPDDPREWLNPARSNLVQARATHSDVYLEDLCYQCQQAAEKAIKGVLLLKKVEFPYTHDLSRLIALFSGTDIHVPERIKDSVFLSQFAYEARYPGSVEPVTESEYEVALALATAVVNWAERLITKGNRIEGNSDSQ